jgi:DNA-3-methyladenine glycosylase II
VSTIVFARDSEMVQHICWQDPAFVRLADAVGDVYLTYRRDPFPSLVRSIIGQQVTGKSAQATWERLLAQCAEAEPRRLPAAQCSTNGICLPEIIEAMDEESLRAAGLSRQKISYVKDLSRKVLSRDIDLEGLSNMPDDQVVAVLTRVKGIGVWTAKMYMIFTLGRFDVFAPSDLGLRKGAMWLYNLPRLPKEKTLLELSQKWKPFRTVAALYLWQAVTRGFTKRLS